MMVLSSKRRKSSALRTRILSSLNSELLLTIYEYVGRVAYSVQRLATGWTVRGQNPDAGEIFRTRPHRLWGPPSLLYNGYHVFPGGKERPGRDSDPSPPSSAVVMKEQSYTSSPPVGRKACTEPQCLYKGALYFYFIHESFFFCGAATQRGSWPPHS